MEGRNPLVRLRPIVRGLFARSLTLFFQVSESDQLIMPWRRIFSSRSSVCFVFLYFNIPRMFKLVFLQVVVLLDINTVFLDTSGVVSIFLFSCFLDCKERTFAWRAATLL